MELLNEIAKLKRINSDLLDLLDQLVRKEVEYEQQRAKQAKLQAKSLKLVPAQPMPDSQKLWVRVGDICRTERNPDSLLPISRSTWYKGLVEGRFPAPKKFGRMSLWKLEGIKRLVEEGIRD
jgi:prophage regulatory protein